jgi:hypothetical protein
MFTLHNKEKLREEEREMKEERESESNKRLKKFCNKIIIIKYSGYKKIIHEMLF